MKRNGLVIILGGLLLLAVLVAGILLLGPKVNADAATVDAANQLYAAGHYAEAARIYEQEVARGVQDSAVYYNLGNAYFQQGDMGRAVLNLQRAAQLAPRDADIEANLELARLQTTELFAQEPTGPVAVLAGLTGWLTLNETAVVVLAIWFLLGFLILTYREISSERGRRVVQGIAVVMLVLLLLSGVSLASRTFLQQTQPPGVVVTPSVAISDGPGAGSATSYTLHAGTKVNVLDRQGNWLRLHMPGGTESWVPASAVEPVT